MVGAEEAGIESELVEGRLACLSCAGVLATWGSVRGRSIRLRGDATMALRPRPSGCQACTRTHVLLPDLPAAPPLRGRGDRGAGAAL